MNVIKDQVVSLHTNTIENTSGFKFLKSFLFMCQHDASENEEVTVKVFCHNAFTRRVGIGTSTRFKKNELKGTEYKFKTKELMI